MADKKKPQQNKNKGKSKGKKGNTRNAQPLKVGAITTVNKNGIESQRKGPGHYYREWDAIGTKPKHFSDETWFGGLVYKFEMLTGIMGMPWGEYILLGVILSMIVSLIAHGTWYYLS